MLYTVEHMLTFPRPSVEVSAMYDSEFPPMMFPRLDAVVRRLRPSDGMGVRECAWGREYPDGSFDLEVLQFVFESGLFDVWVWA